MSDHPSNDSLGSLISWRGASETGDRYHGRDPRDIAASIKREARRLRYGYRPRLQEAYENVSNKHSNNSNLDSNSTTETEVASVHNADGVHRRNQIRKKSRTYVESMEPFKQTDGDKIQDPKVMAHEDHGASPVRKGRMNPSGYGANKKERI